MVEVGFSYCLQAMLAPHGAVVQNIGSQMDELENFRQLHLGFRKRYIINCNTPDYPSPYFSALLTKELDPYKVDWKWWSSLNISSIYYHPTVHNALLSVPRETAQLYLEGRTWQPHDFTFCRRWANDKYDTQIKRADEL